MVFVQESAYYDVPNVHYAVSQSELPMSYRMVNSYSPAPVAAPVCHNAKTNTKGWFYSIQL